LGAVLYKVLTKKGSLVLLHYRLKPCNQETVPRWISKARTQLQYYVNSKEKDPQATQPEDPDVPDETDDKSEETNWRVSDITELHEAEKDTISSGLATPDNQDNDSEDQQRTKGTTTRCGRKIQPPSRYTC
jgi:hypothetical protein